MYNLKYSISLCQSLSAATRCWNLDRGNRRISFSVEESVQLLLSLMNIILTSQSDMVKMLGSLNSLYSASDVEVLDPVSQATEG